VSVKIDNNPRALPQDGLEDADVVFSELVEGGATRFIALLHSRDPGEIGPVRSGREVDVELMPAFASVFAFSGAANEVNAALRATGMVLASDDGGSIGFLRRSRPGVPREHTLYADVPTLWGLGSDLPEAVRPWPIDDAEVDGGSSVDGMELTYSRETSVTWDWDGEQFVRSQYGEPHIVESGERIGAANVVVPRVAVRPGPRGGGTLAIDIVGEGDASIFRAGQVYDARWRKTDIDSQIEWLTPAGEPFPLAPGRTWIELVPVGGAVSPRLAEDAADADAPDADAPEADA
jgi:hypothetical protein